MINSKLLENLEEMIGAAVSHYWDTRLSQKKKQQKSGKVDYGLRGAVTGGAQMDGFIELFTRLIISTGLDADFVERKGSLELPGYFRPTKEWDLLVVKDRKLIVAIEAKSQVGPSFGNNFNNRTEEAMGSALDLWTAYREGAFHTSPQPFLGYFFMLEDCRFSQRPVRVREPHFHVFPEFKDASYMKRYEIFCRKLVLERHYTASAFVENGAQFLGKPYEPNAIIKNDMEFILMQRKAGGYRKPTEEQRRLSKIDKKDFDIWFQQIWHITGASTRNHPAPFPLELATRLIRMFSFYGDTVLDPFCGTGTAMVAALRYGRNSIGIDIEPEYCRMAARYLKKESSNLFLNTELLFERMTTDDSGQMQVCEDQALYEVRSARKSME